MRLLRSLATLAVLFLAVPGAAVTLPEPPPPGLRLTASVTCDFEERWWEATLYPGAELPLEVRWMEPGMFGGRERTQSRRLDDAQRAELFALAREAFASFTLRPRPPVATPGTERPWTGDRTLALSAQVLDAELGRVDRVDLAFDLIPGRRLPEAAVALVEGLAEHARQATLELDCR
jgi:hypothetical protein